MAAEYSAPSESERLWMITNAELQGDESKGHKREQMIHSMGPLLTTNPESQGDECKGHKREQMIHAMGPLTSFRRLLEMLLRLK
jgi:hypothetical protein